MLSVARPGASQKRLDPHSAQNPRRAALSLSGLSIQRRPLSSTSLRSSRRAAVAAKRWPLQRRHSLQWQTRTSRKAPLASYRTAPQRQPPVARGLPLIAGSAHPQRDDPARDETLRERRRRHELHAVGVAQEPLEVDEHARADRVDLLEPCEVVDGEARTQGLLVA